jgi:hypothetical protein
MFINLTIRLGFVDMPVTLSPAILAQPQPHA